MTTNFDADSILTYFRELLDQSDDDDRLNRAVINRAFIAAYLYIRNMLESFNFKFEYNHKDYRLVEEYLVEYDEDVGPGISQRLKEIRNQRAEADYDFSNRVRITRNQARKKLKKSKDLLRQVDRAFA